MDNILEKIAETKRTEITAARSLVDIDKLCDMARSHVRIPLSLKKSVLSSRGGIIAEFKRRSPSRGEIAPCAQVAHVVKEYGENGAAGCSVLTDTAWFGGSLTDLTVARCNAAVPLLRKDFIIDEVQIYQAKLCGADAILLIAAMLSPDDIVRLASEAHSVGLEVLLEIHNVGEVNDTVEVADLIGVNNRDLTNFNTSLSVSDLLIDKLPAGKVKIAESGIHSAADIIELRKRGYNGFLVGEAFMSTTSPAKTLKQFITDIENG